MANGKVHTATISTENDWSVVEAIGEIDLAVAPDLELQILSALAKSPYVLVDLSAATFIDSVTISALCLGWERARDQHGELRIVASHPSILRVFELTGLASTFSISATRKSALDETA